MSRLELELGDRRLDGQSVGAYYERQQGNIQLWAAKKAGLQSLKLEGLDGLEIARIKSDISICERETERIGREVALAQSGTPNPKEMGKPHTPGSARQVFKHPAKPNLPKH